MAGLIFQGSRLIGGRRLALVAVDTASMIFFFLHFQRDSFAQLRSENSTLLAFISLTPWPPLPRGSGSCLPGRSSTGLFGDLGCSHGP